METETQRGKAAIGGGRPRLEGCIYQPGNSKDCQQIPKARRGKEGFSLTGFRENMLLMILLF